MDINQGGWAWPIMGLHRSSLGGTHEQRRLQEDDEGFGDLAPFIVVAAIMGIVSIHLVAYSYWETSKKQAQKNSDNAESEKRDAHQDTEVSLVASQTDQRDRDVPIAVAVAIDESW
mmetsp:Transcript_8790/g.15459  ORF Transcript_8790/g.15459 Transcript_8790/m.15459 type:complete len:116 (+) Transcript_8790:840-1187(+)